MKYIENYNLWWPDFEDAPASGLVRMFKRVNDCDVVAKHVRTNGIAVQAGGHCGLWARQLAKYFTLVHTFEPEPESFACMGKNLMFYQNVVIHDQALGPEAAMVAIAPLNGGKTKVLESSSSYNVKQVTIDSLNLPRCDLIYLDVERYEFQVLQGARETIANYRPVIALEVLDGEQNKVNEWARKNEYSLTERIHSDWILVP